jgi:hypothetical protein
VLPIVGNANALQRFLIAAFGSDGAWSSPPQPGGRKPVNGDGLSAAVVEGLVKRGCTGTRQPIRLTPKANSPSTPKSGCRITCLTLLDAAADFHPDSQTRRFLIPIRRKPIPLTGIVSIRLCMP